MDTFEAIVILGLAVWLVTEVVIPGVAAIVDEFRGWCDVDVSQQVELADDEFDAPVIYVRGDVADEWKRQRDKLLAVLKRVAPTIESEAWGVAGGKWSKNPEFQKSIIKQHQDVQAAIAACEKEDSP